MVIDGLVNAFINISLFIMIVLFVKGIEANRKKNYTPLYWISLKKYHIKLLFFGIITALFYKLTLGLIGVTCGKMAFEINQLGIVKTIIFTLVSSFGFFGVSLLEEGLFRGYLMQVVLKKIPKLLAIILQGIVFGLVHYHNYSVLSHTWIRIVDAMLIGIIFGVIVLKTKSLMFVIGAHLFYNTAEYILFLDNSYKFTRFISFDNSNYLASNLLENLFCTEYIELIMLCIIAVSLIFLFRRDILIKPMDVLDT
jgi:membrane protease YdiL (CAAX protease family)